MLGKKGLQSDVSSKEVSLHGGGGIFLLRSLSKISEDPLIQLWIVFSDFLPLVGLNKLGVSLHPTLCVQ